MTGSPLDRLGDDERDLIAAGDRPRWVPPMLATLSHETVSGPEWLYQRKLDGERAMAIRDGGKVELRSRSHQDLAATYPEIVDAIAAQPRERFAVDGEIVAFEGGLTSFARLQQRIGITDPAKARRSPVAVHLYVFDILHVDGADVTRLPCRRRLSLLRDALDFDDPIKLATHRNRDGARLHREACDAGWEGLIAKREDSPYRSGTRSRDWLKLKCVNEQEFVIGGFTEPGGSRVGLGALHVGAYRDGELRYAGKVGTGFDEETLRSLRTRLDELRVDRRPFADEVPGATHPGTHWVRPELVCQVGYAEITRAGRLRHPRFVGLRRDKPAREVVLERPR